MTASIAEGKKFEAFTYEPPPATGYALQLHCGCRDARDFPSVAVRQSSWQGPGFSSHQLDGDCKRLAARHPLSGVGSGGELRSRRTPIHFLSSAFVSIGRNAFPPAALKSSSWRLRLADPGARRRVYESSCQRLDDTVPRHIA